MRRTIAVAVAFTMTLVLQVGIASAASTPSRPQSPKAVPGNAKVTVKWSAPSTNGGKAIDRYRVQRARSSTGPWATIARTSASSRSYTSAGLTNGKRYYFRVAAHNAVGWGPPSARVSAVPRTVPTAPRDLVVTPGEDRATVGWQAPESNGGAAIDRYQVQSRPTGTTGWGTGLSTSDGTARSLVVPGLAPGTSYDFRVRAHNVAGYGPAAAPVSATTLAAPRVIGAEALAPTAVVVTFDQAIDPASVDAGAAGFSADNGLTFAAASVTGATVALTSSTQQPLTYTVTVPATVMATNGLPVDPGARSATFAGQSPPVTAFRLTDLDLRDPHVYVDVPLFGTTDVTDASLFGFSINSALQDALATDGDGDGFLDQSLVNLFRPLDQAAATTPAEMHVGALCTAPPAAGCEAVHAGVPATATNQTVGVCLAPEPGTTTTFYAPDVVNAGAPCFSTSSVTVTVDLAGIPLTLRDARMGATYVGDPATSETNGLLVGFVSEADADSTIIPPSFPVMGGEPLSAVLPGGTGNGASHSDMDVHEGVPGWWFHLNFVATRTGWTE